MSGATSNDVLAALLASSGLIETGDESTCQFARQCERPSGQTCVDSASRQCTLTRKPVEPGWRTDTLRRRSARVVDVPLETARRERVRDKRTRRASLHNHDVSSRAVERADAQPIAE